MLPFISSTVIELLSACRKFLYSLVPEKHLLLWMKMKNSVWNKSATTSGFWRTTWSSRSKLQTLNQRIASSTWTCTSTASSTTLAAASTSSWPSTLPMKTQTPSSTASFWSSKSSNWTPSSKSNWAFRKCFISISIASCSNIWRAKGKN